MQAEAKGGAVRKSTLQGNIVIDGETLPMERNPADPNLFDFDYVMPDDQSEAAFYFILNYNVLGGSKEKPKQSISKLYTFQLVNKYVIQLQVDRAPVGRPVTVLGRRFFRSDKIVIGGVEAETRFKSDNEIEFLVPPLPAGESYFVQLQTDGRMVPIGNFMIDLSLLKVAPKSLAFASGETAVLVFSVDFDAPAGGLAVRITTDIPQSVIMPEVIIPGGSRSVSVAIEGGRPGQGALFADVPGMKEVTIPISVTE
ncbi:IPT/TIG domain-containing protein [Puniceicoccus vermicola]|uniref:IPT/TIG domain-containing protein n=1 Tax=Puniceicoccus vermicola TaxID=388746 RepID=A0A7X1B0E8_9BACT|nr:IPT/TIG domain-containing protein [Puniceicoccus vermicola]MBC2603325.1 IPT/TIG domain-containing protein [Puniceicoccus vermicola]